MNNISKLILLSVFCLLGQASYSADQIKKAATINWVEQLTNGDFEGTDVSCFVVRNGGEDNSDARIEDGIGYNKSRGIRLHSIADAENDWDTQFFVYTPNHVWKMGDRYRLKFKVRADKSAHIHLQSHSTPGSYIAYSMADNDYDVTTAWQAFEMFFFCYPEPTKTGNAAEPPFPHAATA